MSTADGVDTPSVLSTDEGVNGIQTAPIKYCYTQKLGQFNSEMQVSIPTREIFCRRVDSICACWYLVCNNTSFVYYIVLTRQGAFSKVANFFSIDFFMKHAYC